MSPLLPSAENPRPRQVTIGATLSVTGGVVLLFALIDLMTRLQSLEVTQLLQENLRALSLSSDISVEQARDLLRYSIMVFAVLSAAAVVLGVFTLMRDRSARVGLTVVIATIGVLCVFGGPATWLITLYVATSIALLWSRSAREWFAGTYAPGSSGSPGASGAPPTKPEAPDRPAESTSPW
ncbi:MAG TPA: hypothetical protein VLK34_09150, partial [Nocardioidaceae bacterium]|nr:hypothetical protein [Nocardioidaceae bacterium]